MIDKQNFVCIIVKIGVNDFVIPVETIGMEGISEGCAVDCVLATSFRVLICCPISAPMKSRTESFRSTSISFRVAHISTTLHDIYFSTGWPASIFEKSRHHPDCRPKPITFRQFCSHFNPSICEGKRLNSGDLSTDDRRKVVDSIGMPLTAFIERCRAKVSGRATPLLIPTVVSHIIGSNFILQQNWLNVQYGVVGVRRCSVVIIYLKLMVPSTGHSEVMLPFSEVKLIEIVVENEF